MKIPQRINELYAYKRNKAYEEQRKCYGIISDYTNEIDELDKTIVELTVSYGEALLSDSLNDTYTAGDILPRIVALEQTKKSILVSLNYPEDFLELHFECCDCNDTGYTDQNHQQMCGCMKRAICSYNLKEFGINSEQTFENFDFELFKNPSHKKAMTMLYRDSIKYVESLPAPTPLNLVITGNTGIGKTYALNCIAHKAVLSGFEVIYITAYNLINNIMQVLKDKEELLDYTDCELLIIDDLGTEPMIPNITIEQLLNIINEREIKGLPTVIATNLTVAQILDVYGERMYSRIAAPRYNDLFIINGEDLRRV